MIWRRVNHVDGILSYEGLGGRTGNTVTTINKVNRYTVLVCHIAMVITSFI